VQVTDRRRFAITSLSLSRVKRIARTCGVTVNDVVMALCGGALRRYLAEKGELPEDPLIAFAPVSLRAKGDSAAVNNQVFGMVSSLATDVADPLERLSAVHEALVEAKALMEDVRDALPADFALLGAPTLIQGIFGVMTALHLPERLPQLFNVTVSNVPGLQTPLYVSGAKMVAQYPMSIVQHGSALNMTVMGVMDSLDFGLTGCARAVPDIDVLCAYLVDAFHELEAAVT
jgi:WS/DGAT/MGAT family acyltransferase